MESSESEDAILSVAAEEPPAPTPASAAPVSLAAAVPVPVPVPLAGPVSVVAPAELHAAQPLLVQAAHIILVRRPQTAQQGLWPWIEEASKRLHRNTLVIALANKLVRIAWAVLARGTDYQPKHLGRAG